MIKVTETYVKYDPSTIASQTGKAYILYVPDNGPVGDKFNMGPSIAGIQFPIQATDRFAFKKDAERVKKAFIKYCYAKMTDAAKDNNRHLSASSGKHRRPSYYLWE